MAGPRVGGRRLNCVRFSINESKQGEEKLFLNRLEFSRGVLQKVLGFRPIDLNCIITTGKGGQWDVSFMSEAGMMECVSRFHNLRGHDLIKKLSLEKLTNNARRVVIVRMGSEMVKGQDVCTWLRRYCHVKGEAIKVRDDDGVWTGAWRVVCELWRGLGTYDGFLHIPSDIALGADRGYVHYFGQPKVCRKCGGVGHLAVVCKRVVCNVCKEEGHMARECEVQRKCNLCGSETHFFMNCPRSFANKAKRYEEGEESEEEKEEEEEGRQKGGSEQQEEGGEREENRGGVREEGREGEGVVSSRDLF